MWADGVLALICRIVQNVPGLPLVFDKCVKLGCELCVSGVVDVQGGGPMPASTAS